MLNTTNRRTIAVGISALGIAAAGIATVAFGDSPTGGHGTHAGAAAGRTATAQAETSHLTLGSGRTAFTSASFDSAFDGPAPATRMTDRPMSYSAGSRRTTSTSVSTPAHKPLLSANLDGPVTVHVTTDDVLATASYAVKTVNNTVTWAKTTVDRTVQSLPVKASVTRDQNGTTVTASAAGTSASAHVG